MTSFWQAIAALLAKIGAVFGLIFVGKQQAKKEQLEADNEKLHKYQEIDRKPDVPDPFNRMRNKK